MSERLPVLETFIRDLRAIWATESENQRRMERAKGLLAHPIVVDARNLFDPAEMRARGFVYYGMGRAVEHGGV